MLRSLENASSTAGGIAKGKYCCEPLESMKQGQTKFHELVRKFICNKNVLTVGLVRKLSRRAIAYICAYYLCQKQDKQ
jgi:hypothetical protein